MGHLLTFWGCQSLQCPNPSQHFHLPRGFVHPQIPEEPEQPSGWGAVTSAPEPAAPRLLNVPGNSQTDPGLPSDKEQKAPRELSRCRWMWEQPWLQQRDGLGTAQSCREKSQFCVPLDFGQPGCLFLSLLAAGMEQKGLIPNIQAKRNVRKTQRKKKRTKKRKKKKIRKKEVKEVKGKRRKNKRKRRRKRLKKKKIIKN